MMEDNDGEMESIEIDNDHQIGCNMIKYNEL